jgi:8-oxo-dGTP pyrophosphatase MutT (NUDIX family)
VGDGWLAGYRPQGETEETDAARMRELARAEADPWLRSTPLHFTASALIVHPRTGRVLLRWHQRQQRWLQVGGHGDPGESDPLAIALREAAEESGLPDLAPWPDAALRHVVVCQVAPGKGEPAHEHADLRYFLATSRPDAVVPEDDGAPLRWLSLDAARELVGDNNLQGTLDRLEPLLGESQPGEPRPREPQPREPQPREPQPREPQPREHDPVTDDVSYLTIDGLNDRLW